MVLQQNFENEQSSRLSSNFKTREFFFLTLFPEIFQSALGISLLGRAQDKGLVSYRSVQIRDFATDKHRTVDDAPFGGGEGMLLKADVLYRAWQSVMPSPPTPSTPPSENEKTVTLLLSPQGQLFNQELAKELAGFSRLVFVCGHYEGVDQRFIDRCVDREVSIGDYVLTGGELPALVLADALTRLIPEVVGNERSISEESLERGLLKYPQYTRPREFEGVGVPEVLLSGNHSQIQIWREEQMREITRKKRPDLWKKRVEQLRKGC